MALEKQGRPTSIRGWVEIPNFPEQPFICPVTVALFYLSRVRPL